MTLDILSKLIAFDTTSAKPNRELIDYCADFLRALGAHVEIITDAHEHKANLYATLGPRHIGGVLLSGHTDVVPITGQNWTQPAFALTEREGKLYGRGTADMKGFVACALNAARLAAQVELRTPLHIALSYDEEIGCVGVRSMLDMLEQAPLRPKFCIVGEPTELVVATGHKGKIAARVTCVGREGHSALAPNALNAIHLATDMILMIRELQQDIARHHAQDNDYDIPYTTVHVGKIAGGTALNIVPNHCQFDFEIRTIAQDDPDAILRRIQAAAHKILAPWLPSFPEADIRIDITNRYPPLGTHANAEIVNFVKSLTGIQHHIKVAFGTEGGLFDARLGVPTVVCGPGSMNQGHKPDEFVSKAQLEQCDQMLANLLSHLVRGC